MYSIEEEIDQVCGDPALPGPQMEHLSAEWEARHQDLAARARPTDREQQVQAWAQADLERDLRGPTPAWSRTTWDHR